MRVKWQWVSECVTFVHSGMLQITNCDQSCKRALSLSLFSPVSGVFFPASSCELQHFRLRRLPAPFQVRTVCTSVVKVNTVVCFVFYISLLLVPNWRHNSPLEICFSQEEAQGERGERGERESPFHEVQGKDCRERMAHTTADTSRGSLFLSLSHFVIVQCQLLHFAFDSSSLLCVSLALFECLSLSLVSTWKSIVSCSSTPLSLLSSPLFFSLLLSLCLPFSSDFQATLRLAGCVRRSRLRSCGGSKSQGKIENQKTHHINQWTHPSFSFPLSFSHLLCAAAFFRLIARRSGHNWIGHSSLSSLLVSPEHVKHNNRSSVTEKEKEREREKESQWTSHKSCYHWVE